MTGYGRRFTAAASAGALVAMLAVGWGFARPLFPAPEPGATSGSSPRSVAEQPDVDFDGVVEMVRHHVAADPTGSALVANDESYQAVFDQTGFRLAPPGVADAGLGVSLRSVSRGGRALPPGIGVWSGERNTAARAVAAGVTERVTARDGEIEWDVVLERPLPGAGELRLDAAVSGASVEPTRIGSALRWRTASGTDLRMGELVVKDATGAELYRSLPTADRTELSLSVPAEVLTDAVYPLTVDPTIGPERPLRTAAGGDQVSSAVAFDGTNYLVVWEDRRQDAAGDIFGTRVSPAGVVLDPDGFPIAVGTTSQRSPAVASNGTDFFVAWQQGGTTADIFGARVSGSGTVLDPAGIPVNTEANLQAGPGVASVGSNYLVAWTDLRLGGANPEVFGARVSAAGTVLDGTGINITNHPAPQGVTAGAVAVATDGTDYFVAWEDARLDPEGDIFGALLTGDGVVVDAAIPVATDPESQLKPAAAFDGSNFLVAWEDWEDSTGPSDIAAARVSRSGGVLDPGGIPVSTAAGFQLEPAVASDGDVFLVVWESGQDVRGARLSGAGTVLDSAGITIAASPFVDAKPAVASDGARFFVTWQRGGDIFGGRVSDSGAVLDPGGNILSTNNRHHAAPAVAFDGTNFLVVWEELRTGQFDVIGTRVSGANTDVLDPTGIAISTASGTQSAPAVTFDGSNFFVVWQDNRSGGAFDIMGARVNGAGTVLEPTGITVSAGVGTQSAPAVAANGAGTSLVVWQDFRAGPAPDVFGARVTGGVVADPSGITVASAPNDQRSPAVASDGTNWFAVWHDSRTAGFDVFGARVDTAGTVQDPDGVPVSTAANDQLEPTLAWNGSRFVAAWQDFRSGGSDIFGAGVTDAGVVEDPTGFPIVDVGGTQSAPAAAAHAGTVLVAWRDRRSGAFDLFAARVAGDGSVQDADGFLVSGASGEEGPPAVSAGPGDDFGVVYARASAGVSGSFLRTVSPK